MSFNNTIIYLIGFAGVGKRTIAQELCQQENFRLIDNHLINNVVFPFVHDGQNKLPTEIWNRTRAIRRIALNTMVELGNRDFNYVFTNNLYENDAEDLEIYEQIAGAARKINATFIPIRLLCAADENRKRIATTDRALLYKDTNILSVDKTKNEKTLIPDHKNLFTLDVTHLSKKEAARSIVEHVKACT